MPEFSMATLMVIVGPLALIAAIAFAMLRNRRSAADEARTEEATRQRYAEQDRDDKSGASAQ